MKVEEKEMAFPVSEAGVTPNASLGPKTSCTPTTSNGPLLASENGRFPSPQNDRKVRRAGEVLGLGGLQRIGSANIFKRLSVELESYVLSDRVKDSIKEVDMEEAVLVIQTGSTLLKYCTKRFVTPHQRPFRVDMDFLSLRWVSPVKSAVDSQIFFSDVYRIIPGINSDFWRDRPDNEMRKFGIEIFSSTRNLRLVCQNEKEWQLWFAGLMYVHQRALTRLEGDTSLTSTFIKQLWEKTVVDGKGLIQFPQLLQLFKKLNLNADPVHTEQLFLSAITDSPRYEAALAIINEDSQTSATGSVIDKETGELLPETAVGLTFDEFKVLLQRMFTHRDVQAHFEHYIDSDPPERFISLSSFATFLVEVQQASQDEISAFLQAAEALNPPYRDPTFGLTVLGFNHLVVSKVNDIFDPAKQVLRPDSMKFPFRDYWIASSHNTYLTRGQMVGKSAVGQYIEVLLSGCRCVELDCWDGPDGEPVIYHGFTLTSKIPFAAVIEACLDYGFKTSPYPIILSLEMHCSAKQKAKIGEILLRALKSKLVIGGSFVGDEVFTPENLRGRFLVKARGRAASGLEEEEGTEDDLRLQEKLMRDELVAEFPLEYCQDLSPNTHILWPTGKSPSSPVQTGRLSGSVSDRASAPLSSFYGAKSTLSSDEVDLSDYYSTVSLAGKKLVSFSDQNRQATHVASINEKQMVKLERANLTANLVTWHQSYLSRIFPAGSRVWSSNYNPTGAWSWGSQMVALNYQAAGAAMFLNKGKFQENGNCGYVHKPKILTMNDIDFDPSNLKIDSLLKADEKSLKLTVQVMAAQQVLNLLRRRKVQSEVKLHAIYISVSVYGIPRDTKTQKTNSLITADINPRWPAIKFEYKIAVPSLASLCFEIRAVDSVRSELLAGCAIPVGCIREGFRWVPLLDTRLREIRCCGLLVNVKKEAWLLGSDLSSHTSTLNTPPQMSFRGRDGGTATNETHNMNSTYLSGAYL